MASPTPMHTHIRGRIQNTMHRQSSSTRQGAEPIERQTLRHSTVETPVNLPELMTIWHKRPLTSFSQRQRSNLWRAPKSRFGLTLPPPPTPQPRAGGEQNVNKAAKEIVAEREGGRDGGIGEHHAAEILPQAYRTTFFVRP